MITARERSWKPLPNDAVPVPSGPPLFSSEQVNDTGIDKAEDAISDKTGGKFNDKIDKAGDAADSETGNE